LAASLRAACAAPSTTEMSRHRDPIYRSVADIHISTSRQRHRRGGDRICRQVEKLEHNRQKKMRNSTVAQKSEIRE